MHYPIEHYQKRLSVLHSRDPRIKIILIVLTVISVVTTPFKGFSIYDFLPFIGFAFILLVLTGMSKIPVRFYMYRLLPIFGFTFLIAVFIPFFNDGKEKITLRILSYTLLLSRQGCILFLNAMLKAHLAGLALIILLVTTRFPDLIKGLEKLKVHSLFLLLLSFFYRYIFVLRNEALRLERARDTRYFGGRFFYQIGVYARMIGTLFLRAYERGERVYQAMIVRGYTGKPVLYNPLRLCSADWVLLSVIGFLILVIRIAGVYYRELFR